MRKLKTLIHYLVLVELRATFLYYPRRGRLRRTLYVMGILLWIFWLLQWQYVALKELNDILMDKGVSFTAIVDFRLSLLFIGTSCLTLWILLQKLFWDKDIVLLNCLSIPAPVLLTGLLSRSALILFGMLLYITPYLSSLTSRSSTIVYLPASLVALLMCHLLGSVLVFFCIALCWPLLSRLSRVWLYLIQFVFGGLLGMIGLIGFQSFEILSEGRLVTVYHWTSAHRFLLPTYFVSEFLRSITEGHPLRGILFFLINIVIICSASLLIYKAFSKNMRFPFYRQNERRIHSYVSSPQSSFILSWIPVKARELILKDLRSVYRNGRDIGEGVLQVMIVTSFFMVFAYIDQSGKHRKLMEAVPVIMAILLPLWSIRTIAFQSCFEDRKLSYLLFRTFSPNAFLNWKWVTGFGVTTIRVLVILSLSALILSLFFPLDIGSFGRGLLMAMLYSALSSLLGLNVACRYLRRDSARLSLSGWIEYAFTTSLSLGIGMIYLLAFPIVKLYPMLQIFFLTLLIGIFSIVYLRANMGVKRFVYE